MFHRLRSRYGSVKAVCAVALWATSCSAALATAHIAPGDKVQLTVFNHPDLSGPVTVSSAGDVRVPVAGSVKVAGLSEQDASARIAGALSAYLYHPSVDVRLTAQGQSIFFTGSLVGVQAYQPGETLGAAIGAFRQALNANQTSGSAVSMGSINSIDLRRVRLKREGTVSPEIDLDALGRTGESGPQLAPGDVVLLRAKPIKVDVRGNLPTPTAVYVNPGDTLAHAVAEVGPYSPTTSLSSIGLRRDGVDSTVSAAGGVFTEAAHDGDIVTLQPAPRVSVLGMVEKSGDETLQTRPTLLNALYEAGGPNRFADLAHVKISHEGVTQTYDVSKLAHGELSQNVPVRDGDVVFVPEGHKIDLGAFATVLSALTSLKFVSGL
jgi:protein involved in polysaccharide export with SLBB domain